MNTTLVGNQTLTFSAARGIWTIRGHLKRSGSELAFFRDAVFPVIQVGDTVGIRGTLPVDSFSIYDPLATSSTSPTSLAENYVAFAASSGSSQVVVRSALNRKLVRVERTSKGRLLRTAAPYGGVPYWGYVTKYDGKIHFDQDGQARVRDCWQAQDVVPAGTYSGADAVMKYKDLDPEMDPGVYIGKPAVNLVDSPVQPLGQSSIFIHYGTGFEYFDSRPNINKWVYWTTGCIVFRESGELVPYPRGTDYSIEVVDKFPPLNSGDYMVSGTIRRPGGDSDVPLSGVVVKVMSGPTEVNRMTTDAQGHYWILGLQPPGAFTVVPELTGYTFKGVRRSPALPWLPKAFEQSPHVISTLGFPPDCYGVDFLAVTANLTLFGRPQAQVQPNGSILVNFVIKNTGAADASAVAITSAILGTSSTIGSLPEQLGTVAAGATLARSMGFPAESVPPGGLSSFRLKLTHTSNGVTDNFQTSSRTKVN